MEFNLNGVTYQVVDREAKIGDEILVVDAIFTFGDYNNGDIFEVEKIDIQKDVHTGEQMRDNGVNMLHPEEFVVIEKIESEEF